MNLLLTVESGKVLVVDDGDVVDDEEEEEEEDVLEETDDAEPVDETDVGLLFALLTDALINELIEVCCWYAVFDVFGVVVDNKLKFWLFWNVAVELADKINSFRLKGFWLIYIIICCISFFYIYFIKSLFCCCFFVKIKYGFLLLSFE